MKGRGISDEIPLIPIEIDEIHLRKGPKDGSKASDVIGFSSIESLL